MCGFAGIVSFDPDHPADARIAGRMLGAVSHRGPDASGSWTDAPAGGGGPTVALGHCRLAILDPDPRADQPLGDPQGRWIVFNGEIYNYRELRRELSAIDPEYHWRTSGDTEVLLRAHAAWGDECLGRLDGMFAFALWDPGAGRLLLARDRMGQKPLYWASMNLGHADDAVPGAGGAIAFASELPALAAVPWIDRGLSRTALADYLMWGYIPAPGTIWRGARKLARSSYLAITSAGAMAGRFSRRAVEAAEGADGSDGVATTRRLVLRAVERQMVSDVPIGCFLSGGIDSSIVAAAMVRAAGNGAKVGTFSIGFDDPRYDESGHAATVARHLGTTHHAMVVAPDAAADLPKLAGLYGEPFADSSALPTYYLSRFTRGHVKVALSGDGGDELFGGYDRYRAMASATWLDRAPAGLRRIVGASLAAIMPTGHPKGLAAKARRFFSTLGESAGERYASYLRLFTPDAAARLTGDGAMVGERAGWLAGMYDGFARDGRGAVESALATDRETYLPEDLFTKVDRASMAVALEVRSPLMDPAVVDFAEALSASALLDARRGKMPLRRAFADDLPAGVFDRPKMGFAVPIGEWFRSGLRPMVRDTLLSGDAFTATILSRGEIARLIEAHEAGMDHSQRIFALLMLEWWGRGLGS